MTLTGSTGTIVWQRSTNWTATSPTWTPITGATASILTATQMGALTASTAFRAVLSSGVCQSATTSNFVIIASPKPVSASISANTTSPSGASSATALCTDLTTIKTFTIQAGSTGAIQWQTVASNVAPTTTTVWTDIVGATGLTYTVGQNGFTPAVGGNYFRVKFSSSPCSPDAFSTNSLLVWYTATCVVGRDDTPEVVAVTPTQISFDVKAYPNPYTETFNLSLTTASEDKVGIVVYDMTGRLIERREVRPSDMVEQQIGDRYPSGVYNIVVTQGEEVKTLRVIKR